MKSIRVKKALSVITVILGVTLGTQAKSSDQVNLCVFPPQESLISIPEDDAPKFLADGWLLNAYSFYADMTDISNGDRYGILAIYLSFFDTTLFAVGSVTDVAAQNYVHQPWLSFGPTFTPTEDGFDLFLPDGPTSANGPVATGENGRVAFDLAVGGYEAKLNYESLKDAAAFFDDGFGAYIDPETGQDVGSNFYYGRYRNLVYGTLKRPGDHWPRPVIGSGGWDHQFGASLQGDVKWTWYYIRLDNGEEVMMFDITMRESGARVIKSATLMGKAPLCKYETFNDEEFVTNASGEYISPHSGNVYPTTLEFAIPSKGLQLTLTPAMQDQELVNMFGLVTPSYHGIATVEGTRNGKRVTGGADIQLVGFGGALE
ncbi:MAG TPA: lipocalin family protein [bacterium]|nr:lipocalin family protein [bacterium]